MRWKFRITLIEAGSVKLLGQLEVPLFYVGFDGFVECRFELLLHEIVDFGEGIDVRLVLGNESGLQVIAAGEPVEVVARIDADVHVREERRRRRDAARTRTGAICKEIDLVEK